jgi:hypothetical protein
VIATGDKKQSLRFAVGDTVQCRTGHHSWEEGSIVALRYRDESMPERMVAPYQVRLGRGLIYVPLDNDEVVTKLRFVVGDRVKCNTGDTWEDATVVDLMYQEEGMPHEMFAPYQLQLDNGNMIYAPADSDGCVRRA